MTFLEHVGAHIAKSEKSLSWLTALWRFAEKRFAELPASTPYENYLVDNFRIRPILARPMANLVRRHGKRRYLEAQSSRDVVNALRFLAKSKRAGGVVRKKVQLLLCAWDDSSILDSLFEEAGQDSREFVRLLQAFTSEAGKGFENIAEISALVTAKVLPRRGPRISAASASHEFLLTMLEPKFGSKAFTWSDKADDFTDPLTLATRIEFYEKRFSPRPARDRRKQSQKSAFTRLND